MSNYSEKNYQNENIKKRFWIIVLGFSISLIIGRISLYLLPAPINLIIGMFFISSSLIFFYFLAKFFPRMITSLIGVLFIIIGVVLICLIITTLDSLSIVIFMIPTITLISVGMFFIIDGIRFYLKSKK